MPTPEPLDNPIWSALRGRHAGHAIGAGMARRYHPQVGIFAAAADRTGQGLSGLAALARDHGDVALLEAEPPPAIPGLRVVSIDAGVQMVGEHLPQPAPRAPAIILLGEQDAAEMLALARLTQPGPFFERTHQLGDFYGVRHAGKLVAMAGERLKPAGHTEISGVCTHPDHRGKGHASALMHLVARRIFDRGERPFLHAYASNTGAIALYRRLGFSLRRQVAMTRLTAAD